MLPSQGGNTEYKLVHYHPTYTVQEVYIMILKNDTLSVLGLNWGYSVKYSPLPLEVPSGFAFGNSLRLRAIFEYIPCLVLIRIQYLSFYWKI